MSEQREEYVTDREKDAVASFIHLNSERYFSFFKKKGCHNEADITAYIEKHGEYLISILIPKPYYLAILNLIDAAREATKPPHPDSDPASLLETTQAKLREALELIESTKG